MFSSIIGDLKEVKYLRFEESPSKSRGIKTQGSIYDRSFFCKKSYQLTIFPTAS